MPSEGLSPALWSGVLQLQRNLPAMDARSLYGNGDYEATGCQSNPSSSLLAGCCPT